MKAGLCALRVLCGSAVRMRPLNWLFSTILALALACRGAAPIVYQVEPAPRPAVGCDGQPDECADAVEVTYLGVSGFLIRWRGATILTAPSFSNPPLERVAPSSFRLFRRAAPTIEPDTLAIERLLPPEADAASVILVGHGHYDHLLDVPYVAARRATRARVYGGPSVRHTLMGDPRLRADSGRLVAVLPDDAGTHERAGRWFYAPDSAFRFMALAADHAPTFSLFGRGHGPLFASGALDRDLDTLPRRAGDWKLGEPYSYVIELLGRGGGGGGGGRPAFRIYFQDAPNTPPLGFPPPDARRADLALLCAATAENVPHAPDSLVRVLQPRYALVGHWESFFRQQTLPLYLSPASDLDAFFGKLADAMPRRSGWLMPTPRTRVRVCVCGTG